MNTQLKYMPIFRVRQEEIKVLSTFNFGDNIYPCIEIIKEVIRKDSENHSIQKKKKLFEDDYFPLIRNINAKHVFVDLPIHLDGKTGMKLETLNFLQSVVSNREMRTEYIKKLTPLGPKVIPVISTYLRRTGKSGSISQQEKELRPHFNILAFRTFIGTFFQDIGQIKPLLKSSDFLIMDWDDIELDITDGDQTDIVEHLKTIECSVVVHRNPFPKDITNVGLEHGEIVNTIDNSLLDKYQEFAGSCFSDYVGIKKDNISKGGITSPGFIFYDAVINKFYGFRYKDGSHKKGEIPPNLAEFETTIVPAVIKSESATRMHSHPLDFLGSENRGWSIIKNIHRGKPFGESGRCAAKFKRISMEHYLHCIKIKISNGDFD